MISVQQALKIIKSNTPEQSYHTLDIRESIGQVLARSIYAKITKPPQDISAMDGYAAKFSDTQRKGVQLALIGTSPAGKVLSKTVTKGQAIKVFTGSVIPKGCDTVIIQENVTASDNKLTIDVAQKEARHIRAAGSDFRANDEIVPKGTRITPSVIGNAIAANTLTCQTQRPLTVALLSNGDELCEPGNIPKTGQVINSNPYVLASMIKNWGHKSMILQNASDNVESIKERIKDAHQADIIVPIGGASVGNHDYMKEAFLNSSLTLKFSKVAVRPGKPTWFGQLGKQKVLGLPGNPASAIVCAHLFLKPLLGLKNSPSAAKLSCDVASNGPRETYMRAVTKLDKKGQIWITPVPKQDSSLLSPFLAANALLRRTPNAPLARKSDIVEFLPLNDQSLMQ